MKEIGSPRHDVLRRMIKERHQKAEMSQAELAQKIGRGQTFVSAVERGQHRVSVLEFLELAEAIGFDPSAAIRRLARVER